MTNEEAISALKNTAWIGTDKKVGEVEKAIMMAVEALKGQLLREDATKDTTNDDIISRQAAIDAILAVTGNSSVRELYEHVQEHGLSDMWSGGVNAAIDVIIAVPSAQPETHDKRTKTHSCDCISRQAAIDALGEEPEVWSGKDEYEQGLNNQWHYDVNALKALPSAQPERTCVNCGRTVNNGGWYADGGTRCPIEEHYALPKDGYCHLWEKRNVTDDDYPERREE